MVLQSSGFLRTAPARRAMSTISSPTDRSLGGCGPQHAVLTGDVESTPHPELAGSGAAGQPSGALRHKAFNYIDLHGNDPRATHRCLPGFRFDTASWGAVMRWRSPNPGSGDSMSCPTCHANVKPVQRSNENFPRCPSCGTWLLPPDTEAELDGFRARLRQLGLIGERLTTPIGRTPGEA
jgi:hypothetical protein